MFRNRKKLVIVGDGGCGKTSLLTAFRDREFRGDYAPTVFETCIVDVQYRYRKEEYSRLRPLSYDNDTDVVLVCFAIDSPESFANVLEMWYPEVRHYCPNVPIVLVGNKMDLRNPFLIKSITKVPEEQGRLLAEQIHASAYIECSAKTMQNIREVFRLALKYSFQIKCWPKSLCCF